MLAKIAGKVAEMGGNFIAQGTIMGDDPSNRLLTIKVTDVAEEDLIAAMQEMDLKVLDARYCKNPACVD
jgi:hypothetical protein